MTIRGELGTRNAPSQIIDAVDGVGTTVTSELAYVKATTSGFGSTVTSHLVPLFQSTAVYGLNSVKVETFTATGGTAEAVSGEFHCQTGTSVGGYGVIRDLRPIVYRAGSPLRILWTQRFSANCEGVANSVVWAGAFNVTDTLAVGYYNGTFGLLHQYGGAVEIRTLTVSAGASGAESLDIALNGVTTSGIAVTSGTAAHNADEIKTALAADSAQAGWYFSQNGDTVVAVAASTGAKSSTYSFTNTTGGGTCAASWAQDAAGADKTDVFTAATAWDVPFSNDATKGNVWMLSIPYLGYGNPRLFLQNRDTGEMDLVHVYKWVDRNTTPLFSNPSLRTGYTAASLGSTTDMEIFGGSMAALSEGEVAADIPARAGAINISGGVTTTEQVFWQGRTRRDFGGKIFAGETLPKKITVSTDSSKPIAVRVYKNATTTSEQNWSYVDETDSIVETDATVIAYSNFTGGRELADDSVVAGSKAEINLEELGVYMGPGESISISLQLLSGGTGQDATIAATWLEDF